MPTLEPQLSDAAKKKIVDEAVGRITGRVTLTAAEEKKLRSGLGAQADEMLTSVAGQVVKEELRAVVRSSTVDRGPRLASGADALVALNNDANVQRAFEQQALIHKKKFDAYVAAGFSADQSFELLKLEIRAQTERAL